MVGYEEHGYVLVAPHISMRVGGMEVSGTSMRELLGHPKYEGGGERKKLFKKMFGYFDQGVFNMLTNKFRKLYEKLDISVREFEGDKIGDFLTTIDMKELIKESSTSVNFEVDDGPPIHYRGFSDYKRVTKAWIDDMYKGLGNLPGVALSGMGLGVFEEFADYILGTEFRIGSVFLLLVLILVYRRFKLSRKREYLK